MTRKRVIIIGGGFGGLQAAQKLRKADVDILLVDRTNHHLFQPLLYQVASAALSPGDIATPIRQVFRKQKNVTVIMDNIVRINKDKKEIYSEAGESFPYDILIVAIGVTHSYFGNDQWEPYAPALKTIQDAIAIREHTLFAFENAERSDNPEEIARLMRFVIIGGGPTGVEMAGAIAEIARQSMIRNFRRIKPEHSEIYLVEGQDRLLTSYPQKLCDRAKSDLEKLGVHVLLNTRVTDITPHKVVLSDRVIESSNIIWAAGNKAPSLLKTLNTPLDKAGRVLVQPDLTVPGHPNLYVIGDASSLKDKEGNELPGVAPVAIQEGTYVAKIIYNDVPPEKREPFQYFDKGSMATIGRAKAVAFIGKFTFTGYLAWLVWSFIHIAYIVNFRNRILVMFQWIFWYFTGIRNVRLISKPIDEWPPE